MATNSNSIRQTVLSGILAGKTNAELTAILQAKFPTSAAARKPAAHIGWYRSWAKKNLTADGAQVKAVPVTPTVTAADEPAAETEAQRIERLAAEMAARVDAQLAAAEQTA